MLKVTTRGNRTIVATKAKSFLQLRDGLIQSVNGSDLKIGDYLPINIKPIDFADNKLLDLRNYLSPTEFTYQSELMKAKSVIHENFWWKNHANKTFVLPHSRSDSVRALFTENNRIRTANKASTMKENCVYMKNITMIDYEIPEKIHLDYEFGYLLGAYCAEGCMTKFQMSISNNDSEYFKHIINWCQRHNLTTKIYKQENKSKEGWTSQDIRIYCTILCRIVEKLCGKLSHNKFIDQSIVFSNKECNKGFLDAYIGGDGSIMKEKTGRTKGVTVSSVSLQMLTDVMVMLRNNGVVGEICKPPKQTSNNRGSKDIKQIYVLRIPGQQIQNLAKILNLPIKYKQEALQNSLKTTYKYKIRKEDEKCPNIVNDLLDFVDRDGEYPDTIFDEIVDITEVENTTDYAYDLTVEITRNFLAYNQVNLNDTFHSCGMAIATVITGVPRFGELLNATQSPKMVSCQIYFKQNDETLDGLRRYIGSSLRQFTLKDLVTSYTITDKKTEEPWYSTYAMFRTISEDSGSEDSGSEDSGSEDSGSEDSGSEDSKNGDNIDIDELCCGENYSCISLKLNYTHLYEYQINMKEICENLESEYDDIICICGPVTTAQLDIFVDISGLSLTEDESFIKESEKTRIYLENVVIQHIFEIVVCGIPGVNNFFYNKYTPIGSTKQHWMVETQGSNFKKLLAHKKIKTEILVSNNMWDIYHTLGIEAARQFLIDEFMNVVSSDGTYINQRHVMLLVDLMTFSGSITSISRYGVKRDQAGPLAKASFEESLDNFLKAGVFGDIESTRGISASIMCGKRSNVGTGLCDLVFDIDKTVQKGPVTENIFTNLDKDIDKESSEISEQETTKTDTTSLCSDDYDESETEASESETSESETSNQFEDDESETEISNTESEDLIFNDDEMDDFINF
jgi:hypothetical protein